MDSTSSPPASSNNSPSGYYVWEPAGKKVAIHFNADIIERINAEVMRGFGALPKRGAEVGGILLGRSRSGEKLTVWVQDFAAIPCEHLHGPSFILSEADLSGLAREIEKASGARQQVVGFFRSNTRDALQLSFEDLALLDARFPEDEAICLLIKPYKTRPNEAVLLCREKGAFSSEPQTQPFVFRRKEMGVGVVSNRERNTNQTPPQAAALSNGVAVPEAATAAPASGEDDFTSMSRRRRRPRPGPEVEAAPSGGIAATASPEAPALLGGPARDALEAPGNLSDVASGPARRRRRGTWIALSLLFLLLGMLAGIEVMLGLNRAQILALTGDPYQLDLSVSRFGQNFHLKWNPDAPAVRAAERGEVVIEDGSPSKPISLNAGDLRRGAITYSGTAQPASFRLTLYLRDRATFSATVQTPPAAR